MFQVPTLLLWEMCTRSLQEVSSLLHLQSTDTRSVQSRQRPYS